MVFIIQYNYMVDIIDRFSYIESSLHLSDKANLIMVDDSSDVFFDLICQNFIGYFASVFIREIGL